MFKNTFCTVLTVTVFSLVARAGEVFPSAIGDLELISTAKGIGISTNAFRGAFYLLPELPDLHSMPGKHLDTNVINSARLFMTAQYTPTFFKVAGEWRSGGYIMKSGCYAFLDGEVLTLTDFAVKTTYTPGEPGSGVVLEVTTGSISIKVDAKLAVAVKRLRSGPED